MITCHNDRVLPCLHASIINCLLACMPSSSYAWTFWWLPTLILKCFINRMLICIDIHMFDIHTHVHILGWWLGLKWLCSRKSVHSNALMIFLECWDDWEIKDKCISVLKCLYAWYSHALLITYSHLSLLWWSCLNPKVIER